MFWNIKNGAVCVLKDYIGIVKLEVVTVWLHAVTMPFLLSTETNGFVYAKITVML